MNLIIFVRKVQEDHLISVLMKVQTECSDAVMIIVFLIFSEFLDSEKKVIKRELVSLLKNLFLIELLISVFLIFFITLMIQISAFLKALFSDFSEFLFLISTFLNFLDVMLTDFLTFLADQNMCLCCSKQLVENFQIYCFWLNEYQKCFCYESNKTWCTKINNLHHLDNLRLTLLDS